MKRPSCNNAITIITSPRTDNNSTSEKYPQVQTQHQSNTMSLRRVSVDQTRLAIERMEEERMARRRAIQERKLERAEEEQRNLALGNPGDVDFIGLVRQWRVDNADSDGEAKFVRGGEDEDQPKICICVRKRPVSEKELRKLDHDCITCIPSYGAVWVHAAKLRVDGITKYLDHSSFHFDHSFHETENTEEIYQRTVMPLVDFVLSTKGARATVFAYGQTGSGKTYTMNGIQKMVVDDLYMLLEGADDDVYVHDESGCLRLSETRVTVSFFELYGGRVQDLLNDRNILKIQEDGKGEVVVAGLEEFEVHDGKELFDLMDRGNSFRTTHATEANDTSSRSHAVCQINLRSKSSPRLLGKMSLVDLAGSERGADTKSNDRQRRTESADINKSLLALKECIRALDNSKSGSTHVPYRGSKLTMVLKDCFTSDLAKTTMIATVSPGSSSADHSINTLRYADIIKERKVSVASPKLSRSKGRSTSPVPIRSNIENRDAQLSRSPYRHHKKPPQSPFHCSSRIKSPLKQLSPQSRSRIPTYSPRKPSPPTPPPPDMGKIYEEEYHKTVETLYEEEENLLNLHMNILRDDAELIQEEVKLLNMAQEDSSDCDIDIYASRLEKILNKKEKSITKLHKQLNSFRACLKREEALSAKVQGL